MGFFAFFGSLMIAIIVGYFSEKWCLTQNGIFASIVIALGGVILVFLARVMFNLSFGAAGIDALVGGAGALLLIPTEAAARSRRRRK